MLLQTDLSEKRKKEKEKKSEEKVKLQETNTQAHETAVESHLLQGLLALNTVVGLQSSVLFISWNNNNLRLLKDYKYIYINI